MKDISRILWDSGVCDKHGQIMCTTCTLKRLREENDLLKVANKKLRKELNLWKQSAHDFVTLLDEKEKREKG